MTNATSPLLADALRRDDPDRHAIALLAPRVARARLLTLYALNLELARTPLGARDPVLAQMRVQWWVERLGDTASHPPPPHELLTPLHAAWGPDAAALVPLAEGRMRDAERRPFEDADELCAYVDGTAGALMAAAGRAVGMPCSASGAVAAQARGAGLAAWLSAEPQLSDLGMGLARPSLRDEVARRGIAAFAQARAGRAAVPRPLGVVLFPGAGAGLLLRTLAAGGALPAPPSEFARRAALLRLALTGRWWVGH